MLVWFNSIIDQSQWHWQRQHLDLNLFDPKIFCLKLFWTWIFFNQNYFGPNIHLTKTSMRTTTTTIKMGFDTIEINLVLVVNSIMNRMWWLHIFRFWFNFSVTNMSAGRTVVFTMVNISKTRNLFSQGMTPVVRSSGRPRWWEVMVDYAGHGSYYRQRLPASSVFYFKSPEHRNNYVLSFAFCFDTEHETYQFALSYPYSYSR